LNSKPLKELKKYQRALAELEAASNLLGKTFVLNGSLPDRANF
jgi:hypothetical protein